MSGAKKGRKSYKRVSKKAKAALAVQAEPVPQAPPQMAVPPASSGNDLLGQPDQQPNGG